MKKGVKRGRTPGQPPLRAQRCSDEEGSETELHILSQRFDVLSDTLMKKGVKHAGLDDEQLAAVLSDALMKRGVKRRTRPCSRRGTGAQRCPDEEGSETDTCRFVSKSRCSAMP